MIAIYRIDSDYTEYLRIIADGRVNKNNNNNYKRVYCGIVLTRKNQEFFIPMTHKQSISFPLRRSVFKIKGDRNNPLGMLLFNNAIPVQPGTYQRVNFSFEEQKYKNLLIEQYHFLKKYEKIINKQFNDYYERKEKGLLTSIEAKRTCNYNKLIIVSKDFCSIFKLNSNLNEKERKNLVKNRYKQNKKFKNLNKVTSQNQLYLKEIQQGKIFNKKLENDKFNSFKNFTKTK